MKFSKRFFVGNTHKFTFQIPQNGPDIILKLEKNLGKRGGDWGGGGQSPPT